MEVAEKNVERGGRGVAVAKVFGLFLAFLLCFHILCVEMAHCLHFETRDVRQNEKRNAKKRGSVFPPSSIL